MNFKKIHIIITLLILTSNIVLGSITEKSDTNSMYKKFLPDYVKLQFAGGIGFMSVGVGYTFFKNKLDVTMFYGYVPEAYTIDDLHSISLQVTSKLLKFKVNENIEVLPLNFGWYAHHTFGSEYWVRLPDHYPSGYYWWSPGRNAGIFLGGEIKTKLFANNLPASGTAFYARIGSRGLYLSSIWGNSSIPITDILEFGIGIAVYR